MEDEQSTHENVKMSRDPRKMNFKEKKFEVRESLLTTLFKETELNVIYNLFAAVFILYFLRAIIDDIFTHGIPFHHFWLIAWNFEHFPATMFVWLLMFLSTFIPFIVFKLWAFTPSKTSNIHVLPILIGYVLYLIAFFYFPLKFLFFRQLNCACSFIITCETTRIAMKLHSFIRENVKRAISIKTNNEVVQSKTPPQWPTVEQYLYFMFCPSFIYRDEYPRSNSRCFKKAAIHFFHCFILIEFVNLQYTQHVFPWMNTLDYPSLSVTKIILSLFAGILPGMLCLICLFYGLLHSWLNGFAELMRFGDRQFYLNWWNADNMAEYYRNWNLVVYDWLYAYVYRDVSKLIGGRHGLQIAQIGVFFLSAAFHEYWFGVALRVFYPVMFTLYFVFGGIFFFISRFIKNKSVWNTAMWFNLLIGTGMFMAFYGQEWYARRRCAPHSNPIVDFFLPRHWTCRRS
ncbi:MBOAT family protein [Dictyocaulus viviparus]|uniref:O-acyltransferase n=1 Tax=Dictyocaulus viviparus TaxID=29172 RepID=A0A0D8XLY0_DICVI|nr:MBOAT family protein [Dictyocaulus viviparus]